MYLCDTAPEKDRANCEHYYDSWVVVSSMTIFSHAVDKGYIQRGDYVRARHVPQSAVPPPALPPFAHGSPRIDAPAGCHRYRRG